MVKVIRLRQKVLKQASTLDTNVEIIGKLKEEIKQKEKEILQLSKQIRF